MIRNFALGMPQFDCIYVLQAVTIHNVTICETRLIWLLPLYESKPFDRGEVELFHMHMLIDVVRTLTNDLRKHANLY